MSEPELFIALDGLREAESETLEVAKSLAEMTGNFGFKINLDYLLYKGVGGAVRNIQQLGRPIFADIKMWNGTRTMISVVEDLVGLGVDYLNVYALADTLIPKVVRVTRGTQTKVLGVTVLTHFDDAYCRRHFFRSLAATVGHFTGVAIATGCHGVILPGTTLSAVEHLDTIKTVPGIRFPWYQDDRHEEEVDAQTAVQHGAKILVCGSPIMKSDDKIAALNRVLAEMNSL